MKKIVTLVGKLYALATRIWHKYATTLKRTVKKIKPVFKTAKQGQSQASIPMKWCFENSKLLLSSGRGKCKCNVAWDDGTVVP